MMLNIQKYQQELKGLEAEFLADQIRKRRAEFLFHKIHTEALRKVQEKQKS